MVILVSVTFSVEPFIVGVLCSTASQHRAIRDSWCALVIVELVRGGALRGYVVGQTSDHVVAGLPEVLLAD